MYRHHLVLIYAAVFVGLGFMLFTHSALAATNVYYSVGQSTATNLETGSSTVTITAGAAVFSVAQTGNIGIGDKVTYSSGSVAYISGKTNSNDLDWTLITATGTVPANVASATVTSINRAFGSLSDARECSTSAVTKDFQILSPEKISDGAAVQPVSGP